MPIPLTVPWPIAWTRTFVVASGLAETSPGRPSPPIAPASTMTTPKRCMPGAYAPPWSRLRADYGWTVAVKPGGSGGTEADTVAPGTAACAGPVTGWPDAVLTEVETWAAGC